MNEEKDFDLLNSIKPCWTCLRTAADVSLMTLEEISMYKSFVQKEQNEDPMYICVYCKWIFKKFAKLKQQWRMANGILSEHIKMDTKALLKPLHKFECVTEFHYLGPEPTPSEADVSDDNDADEMPLILLSLRDSRESIRKRERKKETTKLELQQEIKQEIEIKEEFPIDPVSGSKDQKRKAIAQDGFTSRMVRETNEYVVIKLTREQVLEEMQEKSKSESYQRAAFKCEDCVKGFNFKEVLDTHRERHSPEHGTFVCDICHQYCPTAVSLRGHIKSHTTRYKCKICGYIRLSRQHLMDHHGISHTSDKATYRCDSCPFITDKRTVIQRHVKTHSTERHACHQCGKLFKSITTLRVHSLRHDKSRYYPCTQCDRTFMYPSALKKHTETVHERDDYYCVECDVKFKSPETLKHHFRRAKKHRDTSSYKYACDICTSRFITSSALQAHAYSAHGVGSAHTCTICSRSYSSRDTLRAHVWRAHARREQLPTCGVCGNSFSRTTSLKAHMRTHTRGKAHVCTCGASFAHPATLRAHKADKHSQKEELPKPIGTENGSLEI